MTRDDLRELLLMLLLCSGAIATMVVITTWLSARSSSILTQDIQEKLTTYATLAAQQFTAEEVMRIHTVNDTRAPIFRSLVERAERTVSYIPDIEYLYIMRKTENAEEVEFVIENDMLLSTAEQDQNKDGTLQPEERVPVPGERYDIGDYSAMQQAFSGATADAAITQDAWGSWMSGYAPIRDANGTTVAIVGLDMRADRFIANTRRIFSPMAFAIVGTGGALIVGGFLLFFWRRRLHFLQRMNAQRVAMVTVALHKLGGPIATVRWWVELLQDSSSLQKDQLKEAQEELEHAVERLSEVTANLDQATRIDGKSKKLWQTLATETANELA